MGSGVLKMRNYKFIEKLTVLQHRDTKNIVRLMIEHDGKRNYGLQRSVVNHGNTRHYYNKKIWHSSYQIKQELDSRIEDYEEKGFDLMTEIALFPNNKEDLPTSFCFTSEPCQSDVDVLPISAKDVPIFVSSSFDQLEISDLRYRTLIADDKLIAFFNNMRKAIEYLPFEMVAVLSNNEVKVMSLSFKSKPKPINDFNYLLMLVKKNNDFSLVDASSLMIPPKPGICFARLSGRQLSFHLSQPWNTANLLIEKLSYSDVCKVYSNLNDQHHLIFEGEIANVNRSGVAEMLYSNVDEKLSDFIFISSLGFESKITSI